MGPVANDADAYARDLALAARLVRWRADPTKVRVRVRVVEPRHDRPGIDRTMYRVTVTDLESGTHVEWCGSSPVEAVDDALEAAEMAGIRTDIGMGWAYPHPWR